MSARATPDRRAGSAPWQPPTRRAFFAMLGAAAAAVAVRRPAGLAAELGAGEQAEAERPRRKVSRTRWVGHC